MKKKFSRILGVGLTAALLASLLMVAAPVSALTQPSVSVVPDDISDPADYTILFTVGASLDEGDDITIEFPTDTDLSGVIAGDVELAATSGIGSDSFSGVVVNIGGGDIVDEVLTITIPDIDGTQTLEIGMGAMVQVIVYDVENLDVPGDDYTLDVSTTNDRIIRRNANAYVGFRTIGSVKDVIGYDTITRY